MPLLDLWNNSSDTVRKFTIEQMVTMAGDGNLKDGSNCSAELRQVLSELPSAKLFEYVDSCLTQSFTASGLVLQDLVNEFGRRLDYQVENGIYRGRSDKIGFDGLWKGHDGHSIVVEVKTTDAYRINLDTIAQYRTELVHTNKITETSSILIVVGRNDTGDVEAQVRGSKHAWDIRLISVDALRKVVELKESTGEEDTVRKIQGLLTPFEYTRLDNIIEIMFATAKDVEATADTSIEIEADQISAADRIQDHTPLDVLSALRTKIIGAMSRQLGVNLIAKSRATYWSADKLTRVCCSLSKLHERGSYWYAYHPQWHQFLKDGKKGFHILGCVGLSKAYAIPVDKIEKYLEHLYITKRSDRFYYHIYLDPGPKGTMSLPLRNGQKIDMSPYELQLSA